MEKGVDGGSLGNEEGLSQEVTFELMAGMTRSIQLCKDVRYGCAKQREPGAKALRKE